MAQTDYSLLLLQAESLIQDVPYAISDFANLAALVYHSMDDVNWAGFYFVRHGRLMLGPFQGKTACTIIPAGKGVCGTSAAEDRIVIVPDVHQFAGHIACDAESMSEIVLPIHLNGNVVGVLDIDSPVKNRFSESDREGLSSLVSLIEQAVIPLCGAVLPSEAPDSDMPGLSL